MHVCFQNEFLPPSCRPSLGRSSAYRLQREVERTLKSGNQFAKQREILLASLFNQIMQRFSSIVHIKQVASGNLDAYILVPFCVVRLKLAPGARRCVDEEIRARFGSRYGCRSECSYRIEGGKAVTDRISGPKFPVKSRGAFGRSQIDQISFAFNFRTDIRGGISRDFPILPSECSVPARPVDLLAEPHSSTAWVSGLHYASSELGDASSGFVGVSRIPYVATVIFNEAPEEATFTQSLLGVVEEQRNGASITKPTAEKRVAYERCH